MQIDITEASETESHKRTSHAARAKRRADNPAATRYINVPTKFICIDGEGITLPDGTHRYVLLGVGSEQISSPLGLSWDEVCEFLWERFLEEGTKSVAWTGFFLNYDFIQWIKNLPEERARMLLTAEGRIKRARTTRPEPFPVQYGEWEFDILGTKRFKLRKRCCDCPGRYGKRCPLHKNNRWMAICDTGPFFQKAFLKVIDPQNWSEPVVTQKEYDTLVEGKADRGNDNLSPAAVAKYNRLENDALARVLERLNEGFQSLGIHLRPNQWYGPGQAAQAWLAGRAITSETLWECTPAAILEAARKSYFGGWFEIMAHGRISGTTYEYDINSAYPYVISSLPCLEHGEWTHGASQSAHHGGRQTVYVLVYARVSGNDPYIGAMLHRDKKGNIYRPHQTEGWYWQHEIEAAQRAGLIVDIQTSDTWSYVPCDCPPPLREVADIYDLRKKVGKTTPLGITCKLVPNSLYGKFAQSIGTPKYANPIYASLITAGCRTMILNAIATHPKGTQDVLMVATDGIYFRSSHGSLPVSDRLGDWDAAHKPNITLFKPGVYWDDKARDAVKKGKVPTFKARGINATDMARHIEYIDECFIEHVLDHDGQDWPRFRMPVNFAIISASQALHRNDWSLAGTVMSDAFSQQSSNPLTKRCDAYMDTSYKEWILRSKPRENDPYEASHEYEKRFGMDDPFSEERAESLGITPDGYVGQMFREGIGQ